MEECELEEQALYLLSRALMKWLDERPEIREGRRVRFSREEKEYILQRRRRGISWKRIAKELDRPKSSVSKVREGGRG